MTTQAVAALRAVKADLDGLLDVLTPEEWAAASACEGWRVCDVVAHLGATAREILAPEPAPEGEPPMPDVRERQHDVLVDRRRSRSVDEVIDEYRMYSDQLVDMQADLQNEPMASMEIPVPVWARIRCTPFPMGWCSTTTATSTTTCWHRAARFDAPFLSAPTTRCGRRSSG